MAVLSVIDVEELMLLSKLDKGLFDQANVFFATIDDAVDETTRFRNAEQTFLVSAEGLDNKLAPGLDPPGFAFGGIGKRCADLGFVGKGSLDADAAKLELAGL